MTVVLGLLAAVLYGVADFAGGIASRRAKAVTVLLYAYPVGAVMMIALLAVFPGDLTPRVTLFGALGGTAGGFGVVLLYSLMAVAPINVISPVTAVLAAIVPVVAGVVLGERPHTTAWFGIALGLVAVLLVSRTADDHPHGPIGARILLLALAAGLGFGLYFIFLARAGGPESGLWPLVVSRLTTAVLVVPVARATHAIVRIRGRLLAIAILAGAGDALANMCFLLASRHGLLSLVSVLTALYPATTVLLAVIFLRERASPVQRVGLGLAAGAIVLITI